MARTRKKLAGIEKKRNEIIQMIVVRSRKIATWPRYGIPGLSYSWRGFCRFLSAVFFFSSAPALNTFEYVSSLPKPETFSRNCAVTIFCVPTMLNVSFLQEWQCLYTLRWTMAAINPRAWEIKLARIYASLHILTDKCQLYIFCPKKETLSRLVGWKDREFSYEF